jgi:hypothetical protein
MTSQQWRGHFFLVIIGFGGSPGAAGRQIADRLHHRKALAVLSNPGRFDGAE